ncbi:MAG: serine hydrolase [Gemmatimonadetes bacterium]|nr:serine hydrolase [Gemmatimonadota bacterium]
MRRLGPRGSILLAITACTGGRGDIAPRADVAEVATRLTNFIEHEMADKALPALSIVLVDDQDIVWARGFGYADPVDSVRATAGTVYRVGSVSKLFTDLAVMQLVERGELGLDVPLREYIPEFHPGDGAGARITLRQLTSHRAGLVREPPEGHYFDDTGLSLVATVASLNDTELVYPPETRTKYSNAGIAVVGYVLERLTQEPFPDYLARAVLAPLGMTHSSFRPDPAIVADLARAYMWSYDGRVFEAPTFQLGMAPAGSMYAPVTDLGKFMSALFAGGIGANGPVVGAATLDSMLTPQFAPPGSRVGYGIGFRLSELEGRRRIGHGGAIYGFATDLSALPDDKLGVASVTTMDGANIVVGRINEYALRLMLAAKEGGPLPEPAITSAIPPDLAARLEGRYGPPGRRIEIDARDEGVFAVLPNRRTRLRMLGDAIVMDGRLAFGGRIVVAEDAIVVGSDTLRRVSEEKPDPAPSRWNGLMGEYGWDYNTLYIFERDGYLHVLIEWFFIDRLEEVSADVFAFPDQGGLYHGEHLRFTRDANGRATSVEAAGIVFVRRDVGTDAGTTFTIDPVQPVAELRADALAASPPEESDEKREPELVELKSLDSTIAYDIRYATTNNFMQAVFYDEPKAFLQRPAADALVRVHRKLREHGMGLMIHDAYRPWYVTKMFWDATPEESKIFVADPANGSRHNRGAAVDLTLFDLATGVPIQMVGGYDEFSDRSFPDYWGGTSEQRWHRGLLRNAMEAEGFRVYEFEWWHFDYRDWAAYGIQNLRFGEIPGL